ncbi:MAG: metalloregulator ArsR/SmtB family transcription factor [Acidobacteriota bacterium]
MTNPNESRRFKNMVYEQVARIGKAVASPTRLELLDLLCQGPRSVEELARQSGQSVANTSQHLKALRGARLVDSEKDGLFVTYRLAAPDVGAFFLALRGLAEGRLAEIERVTREFLAGREGMEPVDREALVRRVRSGDVLVIDVRPAEEYHAGHIPGARSLPLSELKRQLKDLPRGKDIVAYCRGPYCVLAVHAVDLLRKRGYRAWRLDDGVLDWQARGFRVATGSSPSPSPNPKHDG